MKVAVFIEFFEGKIAKASIEALGAAKALGDEVIAVVIGSNVDGVASEVAAYDITKVVKVDAEIFGTYHAELYSRAFSKVEAEVHLLPSTTWGREIAPRASVRLNKPFVGSINKINAPGEFVRPVRGNKVLSTVKVEGPIVLTTLPGSFEFAPEGSGATVEPLSVEETGSDRVKLVEVLTSGGGKIELSEADIVIGGGRGVGSSENFSILEDLAVTLGAGVGASRAAVDAGWRPHSDQIGQTGKVITPKLYIAAGISGAIQHLAGITGSDLIVAINKDPDAPIFKVADYGVVGDLFEVIPKLHEAIKAVKAS